jgi:pimeloyl-ACP methyl ester carboxylesterase
MHGPATTIRLTGRAGPVALHCAGDGPPLLLVHSVNAAASVAEVQPLIDAFAARRSVFAPDLPGFGASDRSDRAYTPRLMTDALHDSVAEIRRRHGEVPIDALALSTGCEFIARAAMEDPRAFRSLALASPTGFMGTTPRRGRPGSTRAISGMLALLRGPGWGGALFRGLTKPGVVRYFLRRTFGRDEIDPALWAAAVQAAQAPGAEHAPLHFLAGHLFSADIHTVYDALAMPVWMSHGVRGDFTDYRGKAFVEKKPNWRFRVFETGAIPWFEQREEFVAAYAQFLASAG